MRRGKEGEGERERGGEGRVWKGKRIESQNKRKKQ